MAGVGVARPNGTWEPWLTCAQADEVPGRWTNAVISPRALFLPENGGPFASLLQGRNSPLFYFRTSLKFNPSPPNCIDLVSERPWGCITQLTTNHSLVPDIWEQMVGVLEAAPYQKPRRKGRKREIEEVTVVLSP